MANENNSRRKRRVSRQNWKPAKAVSILNGLWKGAYSVFKIVMGALLTVLIICGVCAVCFVGLLADYLEGEIVPQAGVQLEGFDLDEPSYVYYLDDSGNIQVLQQLYADTEKKWADYEEIPEDLIHAAIAIEDHRFYEHQGVDWFTTIKACINMFVGSRSQFGGSSITQQLVKNLLLSEDEGADDVTVQRKVLEIFRATEFEKRYDKTVVLEWYLNEIFLGNRCKGVRAAAAKYFGKELEHLTAAECASIISITNNPSLYNPYRDTLVKFEGEMRTGYECNMMRKEDVLYAMRNYGYLTEEEYQEAIAQEIVLKDGIDEMDKVADCDDETCGYHGKVSTFELKKDGKYYCPQCGKVTTIGEDASQQVYSWFVDTVVEDVAKEMAADAGVVWNNEEVRSTYVTLISKGGFHIYSTLDMKVQNAVDKIYKNLDEIPDTTSIQQLQSGIVIIDNKTGDIVAMAGGVGDDKGFDDYNRAEANLQPGSALKPLTVYSPAFELGLISPASIGTDMPIYYYENKDDPEKPNPFPRNDDKTYSVSRNIREAVQWSVNGIAVNTLYAMGLEYSFNFAKNNFGLSTLVDRYVNSNGTIFSDINLSPLGMGAPTLGVTVRDMSAAYATFANNGVYREARTFTKIYNSKGELVMSNDQESRKILSEKAVNYMNFCLDTAVESGTGSRADIYGQNVIGKTGTTSSNKDRWFCGLTDYYTAAIWTGYDTPEVMTVIGGGNPACILFNKVMTPLHEGLEAVEMYDDSEFVQVGICLDSGLLATDACSCDVRGSRIQYGYCLPEDVPTETCDKHILVHSCMTGDGVANKYCEYFATVNANTLEQKSLIKVTTAELEAFAAASKAGLREKYLRDDYFYLVDENGKPLEYHGRFGDINIGVVEPCQTCTIHTKKTWDDYVDRHPGVGTQDPTEGTEETEETEDTEEIMTE